MNLNKYDRQAFVSAVMDDVPAIDYKEQGRIKGTAAAISLLPKEVKAAYKAHREYIECRGINMPTGLNQLYLPREQNNPNCLREKLPEIWAELVDIGAKAKEQESNRAELKAKLLATIEGCRTLKQALERLPEFEKYLPKDRIGGSGLANLPVANLVADLNAAGWPKGEKS